MSKINVLSPSIFNKIAAGEVVERPASIVKELVENSIDAGATKISVEIINGGISRIVVNDNGHGIEPEDLPKAFMPHATSKLLTAEDLQHISTLGFRGEALASIAAVSQVTVISKTSSSNSGATIKLVGGQVVDEGEKGAPQGTYICVENLFFNIPVRAKFLKKPRQEESEITTVMSRLILANPGIAFRYQAEDRLIFNSNGKDLENAIFSVYGAGVLQNIIPIHNAYGNMKLEGFLGKTSYFKANRTYQTLIINGRWVSNAVVAAAVAKAYEGYMMKHAFPFFVLHLNIPYDEIDVNVHPNKLEVRFTESKRIFNFIYFSVSKALELSLKGQILNQSGEVTQKEPESQQSPVTLTQTVDARANPLQHVVSELMETTSYGSSEQPTNTADLEEVKPQRNVQPETKATQSLDPSTSAESVYKTDQEELFPFEIRNIDLYVKSKTGDDGVNTQQVNEITLKKDTEIHAQSADEAPVPQPIQRKLLDEKVIKDDSLLEGKLIGKAFNTFVFMEVGDSLYIVDQHAAHERILYDKYIEEIKSRQVRKQMMLLPYVFDVNHNEQQFLLDNQKSICELGFDLEQFGNLSFRVSSVPATLSGMDVGQFFNNILNNTNNIFFVKSQDLFMDTVAETACKHAVKGGDNLSKEELLRLVRDIASGKVTMQCPHGRPFVVEFKRKEIDKWFKRVL